MKTSKFYLKCLLVMFLSVTAFGDDDKVSNSPSSTITMAELRDHMYFLASDELGGRIWNKPGYELALKYAASQFRAAGIVPILKGENGKPTYLQKVELIEKGYSAKTAWTFQTSAEIKNIKAGTGFRCSQPGHMLNGEEKKFYFAGYGISEPDHGWDDLKDLDLDGRIAVIMMGTPKKNGKEILPENIVKKYSGLRGIGPRFNNLKNSVPLP